MPTMSTVDSSQTAGGGVSSATGQTPARPSKPKTWIFVLAAAALVAVGLWLKFSPPLATSTLNARATTPGLMTEWYRSDESWALSYRRNQDYLRPTYTFPLPAPITMPAGSYRVAITADGHLGREISVEMPAGMTMSHVLDLNQQYLWRTEETYQSYEVVKTKNGSFVLAYNDQGLTLLRGDNGTKQWTLDLNKLAKFSPETSNLFWPPQADLTHGDDPIPPAVRSQLFILPQASDLDDDGFPEFFIASKFQGWTAALSGKDGQPVWVRGNTSDLGESEEDYRNKYKNRRWSAVVRFTATPQDLDGDHVFDLVAAFAERDPKAEDTSRRNVRSTFKHWVEGISSRTGETLWKCTLPVDWFVERSRLAPPYRWHTEGHMNGSWSGGGGWNYGWVTRKDKNDDLSARGDSCFEICGEFSWLEPSVGATAVQTAAAQFTTIAGKHLVSIDPSNGKILQTIDLGFQPEQLLRQGDFDGDGKEDLLFLKPILKPRPNGQNPQTDFELVAWSIAQEVPLWTRPVATVDGPHVVETRYGSAAWPIVEDLDQDGRPEIIVPEGSMELDSPMSNGYPWGGIALLDGNTGQPKWTRKLPTMDLRIDQALAGPDINGDGTREIFVTTLWGTPTDLYVEALSGVDGTTLWRSSKRIAPLLTNGDFFIHQPRWWNAGGDGWPQLIIPILSERLEFAPNVTAVFSAGTGKLHHFGRNIAIGPTLDVDEDRIDDLLFSFDPKQSLSRVAPYGIACLRGTAGGVLDERHSVWNESKNKPWQVVGDLDGDQVTDFFRYTGKSTIKAKSGATGAILWEKVVPDFSDVCHWQLANWADEPQSERDLTQTWPPPFTNRGNSDHANRPSSPDINGDGVSDIVGYFARGIHEAYPTMHAFSGKTGAQLWTSSWQKEKQSQHFIPFHFLENGTGKVPALLLCNLSREGEVVSLDVQTGKVLWSTSLPTTGSSARLHITPYSLDISGDGDVDFLFSGQNSTTIAVDGKTGKTLWTSPIRGEFALTDWDADGFPELLVFDDSQRGRDNATFNVLNAKTGNALQTISTKEYVRKLELFSVKASSGKDWLVLGHWEDQQKPHLWDESGKQIPIPEQYSERYREPIEGTVCPCNVDSDKVEELAVLSKTGLRVVRANSPTVPLWHIALPPNYRTLGVRQNQATGKCELLLTDVQQFAKVTAYDAASGKPLWVSASVGYQSRSWGLQTSINPGGIGPMDAPWVYFQSGDGGQALCKSAVYLPETEGLAVTTPLPELCHWTPPAWKTSPVPATLHPPAIDFRKEVLPVWSYPILPQNIAQTRRFWTNAILWSLVFFFFPLIYLNGIIQSRQISLRKLMLLPLIVGLFIVCWQHLPDLELPSWKRPSKFGTTVSGLPLVFGFWYFGRLLWQRNWRGLSIWGGLLLVLTIYGAGLGTFAGRHSKVSFEGLYNSWEGWYCLPLAGAYGALVLLLPAMLVVWLLDEVRAQFRSRGWWPTPRKAPPQAR